MTTGYVVGPVLTDDEQPWPVGWEQSLDIDDGHEHTWETCLLAPGPNRRRMEEVVRCIICHVPRCGFATDDDPCMRRRHHKGRHEYHATYRRRVTA